MAATKGDFGVVAMVDGDPVGAAWARSMSRDEPGYGFVDERTPEVTIAVVGEWRGKAIGAALLRALMSVASERGIKALSLSVEDDNPAVRLYERCGFTKLEKVENAWTMHLELEGSEMNASPRER